jgi:hypothetical protein
VSKCNVYASFILIACPIFFSLALAFCSTAFATDPVFFTSGPIFFVLIIFFILLLPFSYAMPFWLVDTMRDANAQLCLNSKSRLSRLLV